jgi:hypothetical protein
MPSFVVERLVAIHFSLPQWFPFLDYVLAAVPIPQLYERIAFSFFCYAVKPDSNGTSFNGVLPYPNSN